MRATQGFIATTLGGLLIISACNRDRPPAEPDPTPAEPTAPVVEAPRNDVPAEVRSAAGQTSSAAEAIAESRCQRETRCDKIGAGKTYSSLEDCLARVRADWRDDLNAQDCPGGVDQAQLDECLTEVRNEDCASPLDTLGRIAACTSGQLCNAT